MHSRTKRKSPEHREISRSAPANFRNSHHMDLEKMKNCLVLLKKLTTHPFGFVFKSPVDPVKLNIPDYFSIIKNSMDLGTVRDKLMGKRYFGISQFYRDVKLTFENAMEYNPPENEVHVMAKELDKVFSDEWRVLEERWERKNPNLRNENPSMSRGEERQRYENPNVNKRARTLDAKPENPNMRNENPSLSRGEESQRNENPNLNKRARTLDAKPENPNLGPNRSSGRFNENPNLNKRARSDAKPENPTLGSSSSSGRFDKNPNLNKRSRSDAENPNLGSSSSSGRFDENLNLNKRARTIDAEPSEIVGKSGQGSVRGPWRGEGSSGQTNSGVRSGGVKQGFSKDQGSHGNTSSGVRDEKMNGFRPGFSNGQGSSGNTNSGVRSFSKGEGTIGNTNSGVRSSSKGEGTIGNTNSGVRTEGKNDIPQTSTSSKNGLTGIKIKIPLNGRRPSTHENGQTNPAPSTTTFYGKEMKEEEIVVTEPLLSPNRALREAMLKARFADTIIKAQQKVSQDKKWDPERLQMERQKLQRAQLQEKARIEAAKKNAAEELKIKRQKEREAARIATENVVRTVELDNSQLMAEIEEFEEFASTSDITLDRLGLVLKRDEYNSDLDSELEEGEIK